MHIYNFHLLHIYGPIPPQLYDMPAVLQVIALSWLSRS